MNTFQQLVTDLLQSDPTRDSLAEFMGWDVETGPTDDQSNSLSILMGWCPRSTSTIQTYANQITEEQMFAIFQENGTLEERPGFLNAWHWQGWHAEQWTGSKRIYFYNPICQTCPADAYEFLVQI